MSSLVHVHIHDYSWMYTYIPRCSIFTKYSELWVPVPGTLSTSWVPVPWTLSTGWVPVQWTLELARFDTSEPWNHFNLISFINPTRMVYKWNSNHIEMIYKWNSDQTWMIYKLIGYQTASEYSTMLKYLSIGIRSNYSWSWYESGTVR